jgi:hypothetical protein
MWRRRPISAPELEHVEPKPGGGGEHRVEIGSRQAVGDHANFHEWTFVVSLGFWMQINRAFICARPSINVAMAVSEDPGNWRYYADKNWIFNRATLTIFQSA